jgi:hypothetical protein
MNDHAYPNIEKAFRVVDSILGLAFLLIKGVLWFTVIIVIVVLSIK